MNSDYIRVAACVPVVQLADVDFNTTKILESVEKSKECQLIVFPELSITGYTCEDLLCQQLLLSAAKNALVKIAEHTRHINSLIFVGVPLIHRGVLYNCAASICKGEILGIVPKTFIPNYDEFYEKRRFKSGINLCGETISIENKEIPFGTDLLFDCGDVSIGVEICEDLWAPIPPSSQLALAGAEIIINLSASNELIGKHHYLSDLIRNQSARALCGYIYTSAGAGESSTDLVFSGKSLIAENGVILSQNQRFTQIDSTIQTDIDITLIRSRRLRNTTWADSLNLIDSSSYRHIQSGINAIQSDGSLRNIDPMPFVPSDPNKRHKRCEEIINIQVAGLCQRLKAINCRNITVGISGGLDSTLALLVAVKAFDQLGLDPKGITGITMPGFGTTSRTHSNAITIMERLGVEIKEISIVDAVVQHFKDIGHDIELHDITYENSQARERTQILMDYANKTGGILLGTGDLSELALGWCTYNGDHISMYAVNSSIPKTLVKYLVETFAIEAKDHLLSDALYDIIDTPISPELIPASSDGEILQKTESLVGSYILHDFFIFHTVRNSFSPKKIFDMACRAFCDSKSKEEIKATLIKFYQRFFSQQFKRSCMPDGPKVGTVSLSPRGDWRMPSDATVKLWMKETESLS